TTGARSNNTLGLDRDILRFIAESMFPINDLGNVLLGSECDCPRSYNKPTVAIPRRHPTLPGTDARESDALWLRPLGRVFSRILQAGKKQVILPDAVDAQIFPGIALADKAGFLQQPERGGIGRNARRLDAVQPQARKGEGQDGAHGCRHVAVTHKRQAHPIAEAAGLSDTAANIGQRQAAQERAVGITGDQKSVALVGSQILGIALESAPERAAGQIVVRPSRLPRREEIAA